MIIITPALRLFSLILLLGVFLLLPAGGNSQEQPATQTPAAPQPLILVHYMPWYASKPVSGTWGWHWTMNHFNPDELTPRGLPSAATHNPPLLGLYDSGDPDLLEAHVLLMKLAGIDGVIIDWYGTAEFNDYASIHRNTQLLIKQIKRAGLCYAICYEDQSVKHRAEKQGLTPAQALEQGAADVAWLAENAFSDTAYVRLGNRPILPVFGPQFFDREQLAQLLAPLNPQPILFGLPHLVKDKGVEGVLTWPPVSGGKVITRDVWREYLTKNYQRLLQGQPVLGLAFPGFRDIYKEAGLHESYGSIDPTQGATFAETLDLARKSQTPIIQIATWNDFGEGTVIEPSVDYGYWFLEYLQQQFPKTAAVSPADLQLPVMLYHLRKAASGDNAKLAQLDHAAAQLFTGQTTEAGVILRALVAEKQLPTP